MSVITNNPVELDETTDPAPLLDMAMLREASSRLRHQVISEGKPYILVHVDRETAEATLEQVGFEPDRVGEALAEVAAIFSSGDAELINQGFMGESE